MPLCKSCGVEVVDNQAARCVPLQHFARLFTDCITKCLEQPKSIDPWLHENAVGTVLGK